MHNDILHMHYLLCRGAWNAWPPHCASVCTKIQTTAAPQHCSKKGSRPIYDLILIIHADILHSNAFSNHSLPNRLWAITSERITAATLCEGEMYLKHIWCDLTLGCYAKRDIRWKQRHANAPIYWHTEEMSRRAENAEKKRKGIWWMSCGALSQNDVMRKTQLIKGGKVLFSWYLWVMENLHTFFFNPQVAMLKYAKLTEGRLK